MGDDTLKSDSGKISSKKNNGKLPKQQKRAGEVGAGQQKKRKILGREVYEESVQDRQQIHSAEKIKVQSRDLIDSPPSSLTQQEHEFYMNCLSYEEFRKEFHTRFIELKERVDFENKVYRIWDRAIATLNREKFEYFHSDAQIFTNVIGFNL